MMQLTTQSLANQIVFIPAMLTVEGQLEACLNKAYTDLLSDTPDQAVTELINTLSHFRQQLPRTEWQKLCQTICQQHPIIGLLRQEPFSYRALAKPRGYAGDGVLFDYIYADPSLSPPDTTELGAIIFKQVMLSPAISSSRLRKDILTKAIDEAAAQRDQTRICAVACLHLREAEEAQAVQTGRFGQFLGLSQDGENLTLVNRNLARFGVTTEQEQTLNLVSGKRTLTTFDLIYSAGLFDYLKPLTARRLITNLFQALAPSGRLLVGNVVKNTPTLAYLEAFLDWWLVDRTEQDVFDLVPDTVLSAGAKATVFTDNYGGFQYLSIEKQ